MNLGFSLRRALLVGCCVLAMAAAFTACGRRTHAAGHAAAEVSPAAVPTPDNTPITVLRTPAGLVLKTEEPTAVPGREATPLAVTSPAPQATP